MVIPRSRSALSLSSTQAVCALVRSNPIHERLDVLTILERALAELSSLLFELLDGTLVDTTALVDKVSSGGGLAGIDVADNYYKLRFAPMHDGRRKNSPTTLTWVFSFPIFGVDL